MFTTWVNVCNYQIMFFEIFNLREFNNLVFLWRETTSLILIKSTRIHSSLFTHCNWVVVSSLNLHKDFTESLNSMETFLSSMIFVDIITELTMSVGTSTDDVSPWSQSECVIQTTGDLNYNLGFRSCWLGMDDDFFRSSLIFHFVWIIWFFWRLEQSSIRIVPPSE